MATVIYGAFFITHLQRARRCPLRAPRSADQARLVAETLLEVNDLHVSFRTEDGVVKRRRRRLVHASPGARCSGSSASPAPGKSVTVMSIMRLINDPNADHVQGEVIYKGRNLTGALEKTQMQRGARPGDRDDLPGPDDVAESGLHDRRPDRRGHPDASRRCRKARGATAGGRAASTRSGSRMRERRIDDYPTSVLGRDAAARDDRAWRSRATRSILIADEPTTALDVTIQAQILALIDRTSRTTSTPRSILITHDLGVVAEVAHRIAVMYAGRIVEQGNKPRCVLRPAAPLRVGAPRRDPTHRAAEEQALVHDPRAQPPSLIHPPEGCKFRPRCPQAFGKMHRGAGAGEPRRRAGPSPRPLLAVGREEARGPRRDDPRRIGGRGMTVPRNGDGPLLELRDLVKYFPIKKGALQRESGRVHAVDGVSLGDRRGGDARSGGRIGLREVDARPLRRPPARTELGRDPLPGPADHAVSPGARYGLSGASCRSSSRTRTRA